MSKEKSLIGGILPRLPRGYFNNLRLLGKSHKLSKTEAKAKSVKGGPLEYGVKVYFQQWDQTDPINENEEIPEVSNRFTTPIVFEEGTDVVWGDRFTKLVYALPSKDARITDIVFDDSPPDDNWLMSITLDGKQFTGNEDTTITGPLEDGSYDVHWEGESWMYFVGSPTALRLDLNGSSEPHGDVKYPIYLIKEFGFFNRTDATGKTPDDEFPNKDADIGEFNRYITTTSNVLHPDPDSEKLYLDMTLSWETLEFDYNYKPEVIDGVAKIVYKIKNFKIICDKK